ncbi:MAG: peptidylprolyl isomerase [Spirochaetes bacterium]|nr:peptidylprolyl isomerase [Spirochaetota bacterium]
MKKVENGNTVKVHYTGKYDDGTVFDSSKERDPLEFTIGSGQVIPGFDNALVGMGVNEKKSVKIPVDEAYGERRKELIFNIPKTELPDGLIPKLGQQLQMKNPKGHSIIVTVSDIKDTAIEIDGNHPLAGQDLNFDIELVEIVV